MSIRSRSRDFIGVTRVSASLDLSRPASHPHAMLRALARIANLGWMLAVAAMLCCTDRDDPPDYDTACLARCHAEAECFPKPGPDTCPTICLPPMDDPCEHERARVFACHASHYECADYSASPCVEDDPCDHEQSSLNACLDAHELPVPP